MVIVTEYAGVAGGSRDVSDWCFESLEKLQESSSDDEYFDAQPSHGGKHASLLCNTVTNDLQLI